MQKPDGQEPIEARFLLNDLAKQLAAHQIDNPRRDANLILQLALERDEPILMHHEVCLTNDASRRLSSLMARRIKGCPISRLRGNREFYSLPFSLNDQTLDPRPDSEVLVDEAIALCGDKAWRIADFGTGTGCLLLATLANCPNATGIGLDLADKAIGLAEENGAQLGLSDRADFFVSDWDSALDEGHLFDLILSNPPYIPITDKATLAKEVRLYDPPLALFAGPDGLSAYRLLMALIARRLIPHGYCLIEIGKGQEDDVEQIAKQAGLHPSGRFCDLAGIVRVLKFQR